MVTKTNPGGEILKSARLILNDEEAAALLDDLNGLTPAKKVENVQRLRIGLSRAAQAIAERDELVKKARRAATVKSDEAEMAGVMEKVNGYFDKYESIIKSVSDENAQLRSALGEACGALQKVQSDVEQTKAAAVAGFAELRKAVHDLGKTAAIPSPLRGTSESAPRGSAAAIAALEKALSSTTHPETQMHLTKEIARLKAQ